MKWNNTFFLLCEPIPTSSCPALPQACSLASPCIYTPASLAAMCACYLPLMGLSATLAIPGGLFMPSMLLGGSFGALCGLVLRDAAPAGWTVEPGLYALCAATAVLGAVFRSSISTAVLMTEACGEGRGASAAAPCYLQDVQQFRTA